MVKRFWYSKMQEMPRTCWEDSRMQSYDLLYLSLLVVLALRKRLLNSSLQRSQSLRLSWLARSAKRWLGQMQDLLAETWSALTLHYRRTSDHPSCHGPLRPHSTWQHLLELSLPFQLLQEILAGDPLNNRRPDGRPFSLDRLNLLLPSLGHKQALSLVQRKTIERASTCIIFAGETSWRVGLLIKIIQCMIY